MGNPSAAWQTKALVGLAMAASDSTASHLSSSASSLDAGPENTSALKGKRSTAAAGSQGLRSAAAAPMVVDDDCVIQSWPASGVAATPGGVSSKAAALEPCCYCARQYAVAELVNGGCKVYPKYRCKPCHNASKLLERAAKSQGQSAFAKYSQQKRSFPKRYVELLLQVRVAAENEPEAPATEAGEKQAGLARLASRSDRQEKATEVLSELYSLKGQESFECAYYLNQRQYKAHYRQSEDMPLAEAQQRWDRDVMDANVAKKMKNGEVCVLVEFPDGLKKFKQTGHKRALVTHDDLSDDDSADPDDPTHGWKRLRQHVSGEQGDFASHNESFSKASQSQASMVTKAAAGGPSVRSMLKGLVGGTAGSSGGLHVDGVRAADGIATLDFSDVPTEEQLQTMGLVKVPIPTEMPHPAPLYKSDRRLLRG